MFAASGRAFTTTNLDWRIVMVVRYSTVPLIDRLIPAGLYLRMSKDTQDTSIEDQREQLTRWGAGKYIFVEEYIDEAKSGSRRTEKRVAFLRMINDLTVGKWVGKVKIACCLDKSRFGRLNTIRGAKYKEALMDAGVCLDTPRDGYTDWRNSRDRIIDSVQTEGNAELALIIAEKGLRGRIRATLQGRPNQTTPYGMVKVVTSPTGEK